MMDNKWRVVGLQNVLDRQPEDPNSNSKYIIFWLLGLWQVVCTPSCRDLVYKMDYVPMNCVSLCVL